MRAAEVRRRFHAKLTEQDVSIILVLLEVGWPHRSIARRFGVTRSAVRAIGSGVGWKHVDRSQTPNTTRSTGRPKLTEATARQALALIAAGQPQAQVGRMLGVNQSTICDLVKGRSWKRVSREEVAPCP